MQVEMLKVFDAASPNECFQRSESIVPQQALALSNSALSLKMSRALAAELSLAQDFVASAFQRILNRAPTSDERKASLEYLRSQAELYANAANLNAFSAGAHAGVPPSADPVQRARESFVHVLFNHNDFVSVR